MSIRTDSAALAYGMPSGQTRLSGVPRSVSAGSWIDTTPLNARWRLTQWTRSWPCLNKSNQSAGFEIPATWAFVSLK